MSKRPVTLRKRVEDKKKELSRFNFVHITIEAIGNGEYEDEVLFNGKIMETGDSVKGIIEVKGRVA